MLVDYYFLRDMRLDVAELFAERGEYSYRGGWNPAAVIALACGVLPNLPGFLNAAFPDAFAGVPVFFKTCTRTPGSPGWRSRRWSMPG
jgi:Cytosine/uracil/thiamine/allantoin permeases